MRDYGWDWWWWAKKFQRLAVLCPVLCLSRDEFALSLDFDRAEGEFAQLVFLPSKF